MTTADNGREELEDKRKYVVDIIFVAKVLWKLWLKITGRNEKRIL